VTTAALDVRTYREAVSDLVAGLPVAGLGRAGFADPAALVADRITAPEFEPVLAATPGGFTHAVSGILAELESFRPGNLAELVRICLLAQVDAAWWGSVPGYQTDLDLVQADDLVDVDDCTADFRFRRQTEVLTGRALRAVERRLLPGRTPDPVGLRFARARPEAVALLNELAAEFAGFAPAGTPPLWVTSLARSVQHQHRLRELGYAAMLPSSHCTGYGVDIVMSWYRRYGAAGVLHQLLTERCEAGQVNVISGGQTWHVCLSPQAAAEIGG
jgi:hypothetical protein